jgi:hypothetical protein
MATTRKRCRLALEVLEERLVPSATHFAEHALVHGTSTSAALMIPSGDTLTVLNGFVKAYQSHVGEPNYNPAFDLNHNGQIGQTDGRLLLHLLPPLSRRVPLTIRLTLAPDDKAKGHVPTNLGGDTHSKDPTILGHTTPGALVFTGNGTLDLKLRGPALVADENGNFSLKVNLTDGINQFDFQAVDPFGQQKLRAFPIYWLNFARFEAMHPAKT